MLLSFQKQVIMEQMAKQRQRENRRSPNATQTNLHEKLSNADQSASIEGASNANSSPAKPNLYLKNPSAHLPPRRQQLGVSNADLSHDQDVSQDGGNQYQLAMSEALARHEAELLKVGQLRKLQEQDFRAQIEMQEKIRQSEKDQENFKKVQLNQELAVQIKELNEKKVAEKKERKDKVMTSGGPTMQAEDIEAIRKKHKD